MAIESKALLGVEKMDVIADKGYHTGEEISECEKNNITAYVSPRATCSNNKDLFPIEKFIYDKDSNTYTCPAGSVLTTKGRWYLHSSSSKGCPPYKFIRYTTNDCKTCRQRNKCTESKQNGRVIDRNEYADVLEENSRRISENPDYYKQRQQIIEHVFGTLKRQRGFTHVLVKGKEKVLGEVGLMFTCYNLSRCISILGIKEFIKALRERCCRSENDINRTILRLFYEFFFPRNIFKIPENRIFSPLLIVQKRNYNYFYLLN
jgi:hypothetical protein